MKILHINEWYREHYGAERNLLDICASLEALGHKIAVIASSEHEHMTVRGRREYFLPNSYGLRSALRVRGEYRRILESERPDVVHLHNTYYFLSPLILKDMLKAAPVVRFVHDARLFCPSERTKLLRGSQCPYPMGLGCFPRCWPFQARCGSGKLFMNAHRFFFFSYDRTVSRRLDGLMAASSYMKSELLRNGFPEEAIEVIPYYTDKSPGTPEKATGEKVVLFVGRVVREKGIFEFIRALSLIKDIPWRANVIGAGEDAEASMALVSELGLSGRVSFLGRMDGPGLSSHYSGSSVVVVPSMGPEPFGIVGIEAMAFSRPVVAFDSGGIGEWLKGDVGFLVPRGDISGLSEKIRLLLSDSLLAARLGENGRRRVEGNYREKTHVEKLLRFYEKAIRRRRGRAK